MVAHLKEDGNVLRIFERIILIPIYGSVSDNGVWRIRYDNKLYTLYDEPDVVKVVKVGRLVVGTRLSNARTGSLQKAHCT
jgi:hypothetical protein